MGKLTLEEQLLAQRIMDEWGYLVVASEVLHELPTVSDGFAANAIRRDDDEWGTMLPPLRLFATATQEEYMAQARRYKLPYPVLDAPYFYKAIVE